MQILSSYITYLARYPLAIIAIVLTAVLAWKSLRSLLNRFRQHTTPAHGFFLMSQTPAGGDIVESYPLFHTTAIGSSRSSDIRLISKSIAGRHAIIYLHEGKWFIRPADSNVDLYLNDRKVNNPRRMKNQDLIQIGDRVMVFVDERVAAELSGQDFEGSIADWQYGRITERPLKTGFSWLLSSLFFLIGYLAVLLIIPSDLGNLRLLYLLLLGIFFVFSQIYYYVLPLVFENFDRTIYIAFAFVAALGLIIQARFAFVDRIKPLDWSDADFIRYIRNDFIVQAGVAIFGLAILPIVVLIIQRTRFLEKIYYVCLVLTPLLYLATLVLGRGAAEWGASLWITLPGGFSLQLTEFAKITYLIVLANFFKIRPPLKTQLLFAVWAGFNFILIMLLPDLGSMMILLPVTLIVFSVMTSEYLKTAGILIGGAAIFFAAYKLLPYVQNRLYGWLTLWTETNAFNEQIIYGLQAIARGSIFGRGLGVGNPRSIPLASSDMVFSVICEEMGILVGLAIILCFIISWLRGANAAAKVRDGFTSSLILALATYFFIEAAVVIAGTTGLIPLTGATLPLIAKGGSSMIAKWLMVGMLIGLCCRNEEGAYR
ncbi:MAG TPA: FtsW/RodA/SpoVE family cell cycle protein [Clostridiaceae bacterium]|nr:FtsW/RodA/SpoVE family cell cycle protein [Clostridiaceae bacterium]